MAGERGLNANHQQPGHQRDRQMNKAKSRLFTIRESLLLSKSELARKANVSPITIARIEAGKPCRMETQRKILRALGFNLSDRDKVFDEG